MIHTSCHSPEITETHEQKLQRYRNSKMCECSEPELWQEVHRIVGPKDIDGVSSLRARLVVQQVATGDASQLGFSSSTPSGESIRSILTYISTSKLHISTLDVSTAFMNSKLPPGVKVCIRLPSDISLDGKIPRST